MAEHLTEIEADPILRTYGELGDGNQVSRDQPAQRALLNEACARRLMLAHYQRFPEGYEFEHHLVGEQKPRTVILLSPPDLVAICDEDGLWARHPRQESLHGPQPYSTDFYSIYLFDSGLPSWFMSKAHRDMSVTNYEQILVGIQDTAHRQYLEVRYPTAPMQPMGDGAPASFKFNMSEEHQLKLARNFPVTNLLMSEYSVVVSGGYIVIDPPSTLSAQLAFDEITWTSRELKSSYIIKEPTRSCDTQLPQSNAGYRQELIDSAERDKRGKRVNPSSQPQGVGHWDWLEAGVDSPRAKVLEIFDPAEMAAARMRGLCQKGMARTEAPAVVWHAENQPMAYKLPEVYEGPRIQNLRHWNPSQQPPGQGVWKFADDASREKAAQLFGNGEGFSIVDTPFPSAEAIFNLRLQFQFLINKGRLPHDKDPTQSITLVWEVVAQVESPPAGAAAIKARAKGSSTDVSLLADNLPPPDHDYGWDERSMLQHSPLNGGKPGSPNDQRGLVGEAHYMTAMIHGTIITLDRSPAQQDKPHQSHKLRVYDTRWYPYQPVDEEFDWSDAASIAELNKWRTQIMGRRQWPKLREMHRTYTTEQRAWLLENAMLEPGAASHLLEDVTDKFNEHFGLSGSDVRDTRTINNVCRLLRDQRIKAEEEAAAKRRASVMEPDVKKATAIDDVLSSEASDEDQSEMVSKKRHRVTKDAPAAQDLGLKVDGEQDDAENDDDSLGSDADAEHEIEDMEIACS